MELAHIKASCQYFGEHARAKQEAEIATLDDILTTQKNGVVAINNISQTTSYLEGKITSNTINSSTLLIIGSGRLVRVSVMVAGAVGTAYNSSSISGANAANSLYVIPAAVGIHDIGVNFTSGLVISPGAGQSLNVTYSVSV